MYNNSTNAEIGSLIITLQCINIHVMIWTGSFLLLAGNIGCIGNLLVFRSNTYRRQACFIYLFWETMASFFILDCILLTRILESGFQISLMVASDAFCRIREFISLFMYQNENTLFLFATIDRILSAQRSIRLRQWSNRVSLAYKIIMVNALIWLVGSSHRLVLYTNSSGSCLAQEGLYMAFDTYLEVVLSAIGSPIVVIVLAGLLWYTVRLVVKRRMDYNDQSQGQNVELRLMFMFFLQSILAIITYVPFGFFILYRMFSGGWIKSPLWIAWEELIICFIRLSSYLFPVGSFYVYLVSNRNFRKHFRHLFKRNRTIHPGLSVNNINRLGTRTL